MAGQSNTCLFTARRQYITDVYPISVSNNDQWSLDINMVLQSISVFTFEKQENEHWIGEISTLFTHSKLWVVVARHTFKWEK